MKIYCSGIGGIGLSAYAALQKQAGHDVSGSDRSESSLLEDLRSQGIPVGLDQSGASVPADIDLFVYTEALPEDAPERTRARGLGIKQLSYPQAVGELTSGTTLIAVCGTHGKSSTTAMVARLCIEAGLDPTVIVGTKLREMGNRNWRKGKSDLFILEACEYKHSFYAYDPSIILLTNCDGDHFDFYPSMESYREAFVTFLRRLPQNGKVITHMQDPDCKIMAQESGKVTIDADQEPLIPLKTPGEHMRKNAQLALSLARVLGVPEDQAKQILGGYAGSWRRIELRGTTMNGVPVIDDYGHHPVEIRATLAAIKEAYPSKRLVCVFQPHTHDRTLKLYEDFTKAFTDADVVIIPNIYDARAHADANLVSVPTFVQDIKKASGTEAMHGTSLKETESLLSRFLTPNDVLICMGAGDITNLASSFIT